MFLTLRGYSQNVYAQYSSLLREGLYSYFSHLREREFRALDIECCGLSIDLGDHISSFYDISLFFIDLLEGTLLRKGKCCLLEGEDIARHLDDTADRSRHDSATCHGRSGR